MKLRKTLTLELEIPDNANLTVEQEEKVLDHLFEAALREALHEGEESGIQPIEWGDNGVRLVGEWDIAWETVDEKKQTQ